MADTKISDLTVETTPPAATDYYVAAQEDTTNTAVPASMITLEHDTAAPVGSNVTAAIGKWYDLTIAGLTADRLFVLPDSVAVGSIVGFRVNDGDADYELKVATAASGSLLEGVDESAGSDEYCVFIAGESMKFRCIKNGGAGDTDWAVEVDGRIPQSGEMYLSSDQTDNDASTWTNVPYQSSRNLRGLSFTAGVSSTANPPAPTVGQLSPRRNGNFTISAGWVLNIGLPVFGLIICAVKIAGTTEMQNGQSSSYGSAYDGPVLSKNGVQVDAGEAVTSQVFSTTADTGLDGATATFTGTYLSLIEEL